MRVAGITPPQSIHLDGKLHRFRSGTKGTPGHGDKTGWVVAYGDGVPAGKFGCWRAGIEMTWRADVGRALSVPEEMAHARRMREAQAARDEALRIQRDVVADTTETIWSQGTAASPEHPYLARKGIAVHGARVTGDGRLMVPLYTPEGKLASLQYIDPEGGKLYHAGGQTGSCLWMLGTMDEPGILYVAEGFATAATVNEVTGRPCIISYSASNIVPVMGTLRERYGSGQEIVIVADNDQSGVGMAYATQAVAKHGGRVVMPPEQGDANDYRAAGGDLKALLLPTSGTEAMRRLEVQFGDELPAEYEPPDELVEDMMVRGKSTVIYGDSNSGKTFFALGLAAAIAEGREAYGKRTDPGIVVYLACEAPGSIKARLKAISQFHGVRLKRIAVVPVPLNFYTGDADAAAVIAAIREIEAIKGEAVKLVIGDTLARMSSGANENSGEDMGPVMDRFEEICRATGAAMMIIHHNGKDAAKGARGWSGIRAHIDTEIEVVEKDGSRSATITKQRELASKGEIIYFKLEVVEMGETKFGKPATTCVAVLDIEATESEPGKKATKQDDNAGLWEGAWWASGAEIEGGFPYVSRAFMKEYLAEKRKYTAKTISNKLDAKRSDGIVLGMVNEGKLQAHQHGWQIICPVKSSAMMMAKKASPNLP
jgi:phage/plasmid primase-like uncharacterized protein